jgi:CHASE2 domain-containing sensor protein
VTVAAETGLVGLGLFAWAVVAVLVFAFRRRRRSIPLIAGLGIAAVLCHSLFYNAFFEDPMAWGVFGLAPLAAVALARERVSEPRPRAAAPQPAVAAAQQAGRSRAEAG